MLEVTRKEIIKYIDKFSPIDPNDKNMVGTIMVIVQADIPQVLIRELWEDTSTGEEQVELTGVDVQLDMYDLPEVIETFVNKKHKFIFLDETDNTTQEPNFLDTYSLDDYINTDELEANEYVIMRYSPWL